MDRFIVLDFDKNGKLLENLKSNMDRFIEHMHHNHFQNHKNLKSNMDRFIVFFSHFNTSKKIKFKIQYG